MNKPEKLPSGRVLVTGATGGIGIALVRRFASAGHDLVLVARNAERLEAFSKEIVEEYGIKAATIPLDLMQAGAARELAAKLAQRRIAIDILVNNAGVTHQGRFDEMAPHQHQQIIGVNVVATTDLLAEFIPPMVERGHGRVLNVVGAAAFIPVPFMATYGASKAYLLSLTESLAEELVGTGVTLCALCPGVTATPMTENIEDSSLSYVKFISPTVSDPAEVADAAYDACMRGQVIRVPGTVNQLMALAGTTMPKRTARRLVGFLARRTA